jgi:diguanylate cyclase (GGDEF)-like protein/PAS domain S-box-containing protein
LNAHSFCENRECIFGRKDGSRFVGLISARITSIFNAPHIVSTIHDITIRKNVEDALMESEEMYRSILQASPDSITITDLEGQILMVSPAAKTVYGYDLGSVEHLGKHILDFIIPEDRERAKANILFMHQGGNPSPTQYMSFRRDQSRFHIEVNSGFIRNSQGQPIKMVFVIRDITERKLAEQKIQHLVHQLETERNTAQINSITDSLTGLLNRRYFDEAIKTEFNMLKRSSGTLSLLMLDVDYFKSFNDTHGHIAGDNCLRAISSMLKTTIGRASDTVARYGGEEFIVILPETNAENASILAEQVRHSAEELAIPHGSSEISSFVTVSIGIASITSHHAITPEALVSMADNAMYEAKREGRNRIAVFSE